MRYLNNMKVSARTGNYEAHMDPFNRVTLTYKANDEEMQKHRYTYVLLIASMVLLAAALANENYMRV